MSSLSVPIATLNLAAVDSSYVPHPAQALLDATRPANRSPWHALSLNWRGIFARIDLQENEAGQVFVDDAQDFADHFGEPITHERAAEIVATGLTDVTSPHNTPIWDAIESTRSEWEADMREDAARERGYERFMEGHG